MFHKTEVLQERKRHLCVLDTGKGSPMQKWGKGIPEMIKTVPEITAELET